MFTGRGVLVAQGGLRLPLTCEHAETAERGQAGQPFCDVSERDPGIFAHTMRLEDEGVVLKIVVTRLSDHRLGFVGKTTH